MPRLRTTRSDCGRDNSSVHVLDAKLTMSALAPAPIKPLALQPKIVADVAVIARGQSPTG